MLFKSPVYSQASGSIAGITYSRNRGGMYARARAIPTDPASAFQLANRNNMTDLVDAWIGIVSPAQRAAWKTYGDNVAMTNRLGETVFLTGQQHYVRSNLPRLQIEFPRIDDAPTIFDLGQHTTPTVQYAYDTPSVVIAFEETDVWCDEDATALIIFASREQNPTINFFQGPYRLAGTIDGDSVSPPTSPQIIASPFAYNIGNQAFARARITRADGRLSANIDLAGTIIVAAP